MSFYRAALAVAGLITLMAASQPFLPRLGTEGYLFHIPLLMMTAALAPLPFLVMRRSRRFLNLLSLDDFNKHVLVVGRTGSGKTSLVRKALDFLRRRGVRVVVIDWKGEYDLNGVPRIRGFDVFKVFGDRLTPLVLAEALREAFNLSEPQAYVMLNVLQQFYEKGLDNAEALLKLIKDKVPASKAEAEIQAALLRRLWVLTLHKPTGFIPSGDVVIDLSDIPLTELKTMYATLALWNVYRESVHGGARSFHTIVVIEEAQNIVRRGKNNDVSIGERMVNECRAFGVGCIIVAPDPFQLPLHLESDVGAVISFGTNTLPPRLYEHLVKVKKVESMNKLIIYNGEFHFRKPPRRYTPAGRSKPEEIGDIAEETRRETVSIDSTAPEDVEESVDKEKHTGIETIRSQADSGGTGGEESRAFFRIGPHLVEEVSSGGSCSSLRCISCGFTVPLLDADRIKEHRCRVDGNDST
ncbi:conserved hypothetical protein [Candidatus Caldarchaeum subterraneum]|uniref:AAA+ ATPase domain-containing protein n=1 Tax=Caldiarchaeum subterraneum TaxID=311458 RepID=E6N6S2_CALS0|nr:conserved hypothetical protein [Candidatus Caldarchaeum subterraneum]BAJ50793.1 conserved hypothetical protein [Candidatus Caldarchaeum subterraneum]